MASVRRRLLCPRAAAPLAALVALASALLAGPSVLGAARQGDPRERVVFVSAVTGDGTPVTDLSARDLVVKEDGVRREILRVERAESPMTIAVAVDNSQAAASYIADYRRALKPFVERMAGPNSVALTTFGDRPTIVVDYTTNASQLAAAVDRIFPAPDSGAYFLDAVRELSKGFAKRDFERGAIVAVATDGPEFSDRHYSNVLPELQKSGAALYVLNINSGRTPNMRDDGYRNRATLFDEGARLTGGTRTELLNSLTLPAALKRLGDQLSNQYRVTYSRPDSLIPPENVDVTATREGVTARGTPMKTPRG